MASARNECGEGEGEGAPGPATATAAGPAPAPAPDARSLHARSFKLRFASQRELGRSYVSLTKPLGLPATVTGKFYRRERPTPVDEEGARGALRRIQDMFERGPRERYAAPATSAQEYGWHAAAPEGAGWRDPRLARHVRDSAWLRARLAVLAADDRLRPR